MSNQPVDILCVNETFLDSPIDNNEVSLPGYKIYRNIVDHVMEAELSYI